MNPDQFFVIGLLVGLLSIPALISAFSESRPPRAAAIMVMISIVLILLAVLQKPGGYDMGEVPGIVAGVLSDLVN
ncbi:MAG: hypothetical protein HLUCCA09_03000 [Rhodobacteraceae bacterium HLUCCA09]|nr:MAG: hypothetical protein HLUCCA09_03000 [Rhodobacteraceae bacterium HLUCCA09]